MALSDPVLLLVMPGLDPGIQKSCMLQGIIANPAQGELRVSRRLQLTSSAS
jgi:hypothetical protein